MNIYRKNPILVGEAVPNRYTFLCQVFILLGYAFILFLNLMDIFIIEKSIVIISFLLVWATVTVSTVMCMIVDISKPWVKYYFLGSTVVLITISQIALTYHAVIISVVPIVYSAIYQSRRTTNYTFVMTIASVFIAVYGGYYLGLCDANMALLTTKTLAGHTVNGKFELSTINPNPNSTLFLYFVLPRCLVMTSYIFISLTITKIIKSSNERAINLQRLAETDGMTGLYNKNYFNKILEIGFAPMEEIGVIYFDLNNLKLTNDQYGHEEGDRLITDVAECIKAISEGDSLGFRIGGDEFILIIKNITEEKMERKIDWLDITIRKINKNREQKLSVSYGYSIGSGRDIRKIINEADEKMYERKTAYKQSLNRQDEKVAAEE